MANPKHPQHNPQPREVEQPKAKGKSKDDAQESETIAAEGWGGN